LPQAAVEPRQAGAERLMRTITEDALAELDVLAP
jgi:hypothetical protein